MRATDLADQLIVLANEDSYAAMSAIAATLVRRDHQQVLTDVVRSLVLRCARTVEQGAPPAVDGERRTTTFTTSMVAAAPRMPPPVHAAVRALLAELERDPATRDRNIHRAVDTGTADRVDVLGHLLRWIRDTSDAPCAC